MDFLTVCATLVAVIAPVGSFIGIYTTLKRSNKETKQDFEKKVQRDAKIDYTLEQIQSDVRSIRDNYIKDLESIKKDYKALSTEFTELSTDMALLKQETKAYFTKLDKHIEVSK